MVYRLEDFSRDALEKRFPSAEYIVNYTRTDYSCGYTVVSYNHYLRPSTHLICAAVTLGIFLPVTLLVDGVDRLLQDKTFQYFHTQDGVYLGSTTNEAIISANEHGERKMREKEYEQARSYINIAYNLCYDSRENEFKRKRDAAENEMERERKEKEREEKEREERERNEKEREERERKEKEREERERKEKEQVERESRRERMQEQLRRMELKDSTSRKSSTATHLQANVASHYVISSRDIV